MELNRFLGHIPLALSRLSPELVVLDQSDAAREEYGDGVGKRCYEAYFGRTEPCHGCNVREVLRGKRTERWFLRQDNGDGDGYFEVSLSPVLDDEGEVRELIEIVRDATLSFKVERHLIEGSEQLESEVADRARELALLTKQTDNLAATLQDLRQDQAAMIQTEKMASVGRLAAGLTHEMHTPLGAMISNADMLERCVNRIDEQAAGAQTKKNAAMAKELMELQRLATERMQKILGSLRRFAHLDKAEVESYDLHEGIEAALALLGHQTKGRVEIDCRFGELPQVICRPDAINQVFMNLLENAVTAIEGPGRIEIETRMSEDGQVELIFKDSGCGISAENLQRILEPGFTTKPRGVGTGLGLAIVQGTIKSHNGSLQIESEVGKGSCFRIKLPLRGEA